MKGIVEIFKEVDGKKTLVYREDNLIVDGAGTTIVDALTISPSLSAIPSASSILDASNFTIQAITFGAPSGAYTRNLHSTAYPEIVSGLDKSTFIVLKSGSGDGYYPETGGLAEYPNPFSIKLEKTCSPSGTWNGANVSLPYTTSGGYLIEDFGHHQNVAALTGIYPEFGVSAPLAVLFGSYAPVYPPDTNVYIISSVSQLDSNYNVTSCEASDALNSNNTYNGFSLVDRHGFIPLINQQAESSPSFAYGSGLQLSGNVTFCRRGEVCYGTQIAPEDVCVLNLYGGIFNIGLWSLDLSASLSRGNTPPYSFNALNNPMRYRLFCKKTFTSNLAYSPVLAGHAAILVKWRIKFL